MELDRLVFTFFNAGIAREYWPDIAKGFVITVRLGLAVIVTGLALGLVLAMLRSLQRRALNLLIVVYADAFRALPALPRAVRRSLVPSHKGRWYSAVLRAWLKNGTT